MGKPLHEISLARLLADLFQLTRTFEMEAQPQLLLLQKTMLIAEGVGRTLDPTVNMWSLARPLIEDWVVANRGPDARIRDVVSGAVSQLERLPRLIGRAEAVVEALSGGYDADYSRRESASHWAPNWVVAGLVLIIVLLVASAA